MQMTSNAIVRIKYNYMVVSEPQALFSHEDSVSTSSGSIITATKIYW